MTFKEKYEVAPNWLEKVLVMNLYHKVNDVSIKATARYFGVSTGLVSENLQIARNYELVKNSPSRNLAMKFLRESQTRVK